MAQIHRSNGPNLKEITANMHIKHAEHITHWLNGPNMLEIGTNMDITHAHRYRFPWPKFFVYKRLYNMEILLKVS
jgi:hypothetical protein